MKKQIKRYKALGFVEALLAIVVAGIASILLMGVAIDTVAQVVRTDEIDEITQLAIESGEMVKNIAEKNNTSTETLFPNINGSENSCFELNTDTNDPTFVTDGGGSITAKCNYEGGQRANCVENSTTASQGVFRVFCMTPESDPSTGLVVGKIIVGKNRCDSSEECDIPDYEYYVLTKTTQK